MRFRDGVRFIELADVTDPALIERTVSAQLGLGDERARSPIETLVDGLRDRRLLLVLDNCEHLITATAALVDTLLGACPHVRLLTTSRAPLAVIGEVVFRVPPLGLPRSSELAALHESDAVRLFVDRARASYPGFDLDSSNAAPIADICRGVDGLPLAIELAASHIGTLAPAEIATRAWYGATRRSTCAARYTEAAAHAGCSGRVELRRARRKRTTPLQPADGFRGWICARRRGSPGSA